jgi:hypothetical protein
VVYVIPLLPQIPTKVKELIPLLVALGVIGLAQEPEGTVALARRQTRYVLGVLRPLPRPAPRERAGVEPAARSGVHTGKVVPGHVR